MSRETILEKQVKELCEIDKSSKLYDITILANISALLFHAGHNLNWLGFYIIEDSSLKLGPFQGKVACSIIPIGKGVCGTSIKSNKIFFI